MVASVASERGVKLAFEVWLNSIAHLSHIPLSICSPLFVLPPFLLVLPQIIFRHASRLLSDWAHPEAAFAQQMFTSKQLLEKVFKKSADLLVVRIQFCFFFSVRFFIIGPISDSDDIFFTDRVGDPAGAVGRLVAALP